MAITKVSVIHDARKRLPWIVRWFGEFEPEIEKSRRYSKSFRLKRKAERFQAEKQAEFDKGKQRDRPTDIALGEFCKKYMERRKHEWREKTRLHCADLCRRLTTFLGADKTLRSITPDQASRFWSQAKNLKPGAEGNELSRYTRNRIVRDAKTMFRYAVEWGDLHTNPFAGLKQMRVGKKNRRDWHYIKPYEYLALLRTAPSLRWKVVYALAYTSAARFGELFNLTDSNLDLGQGKLLIRHREASAELPPFHVKDHEDREIPLPRHTVKLVAGWLKARPEGSPLILLSPARYRRVLVRWREHRSAMKPWLNDFLVNNTLRELRRHAAKAGITSDGVLTMHCFRKSCAQNWADHLPMNVVKELMGHADIGTTAEFYSTVTSEHEAHAQWILDSIISGAGRNKSDAKLTPKPVFNTIRRVG